MSQNHIAKIAALGGQLLIRKCLVPAYQLSGHNAARTTLTQTVLHTLDLNVVPSGPECGNHATVMSGVAVPIGGSLPGTHRRQVGRLLGGDLPLIHGVVGDAVDSNLAVG